MKVRIGKVRRAFVNLFNISGVTCTLATSRGRRRSGSIRHW